MEIVIATATLLFLVAIIMYNSVVNYKWHRKHAGDQYKEEAKHYYWNFIYCNPDDPRLFKPRGGGYTVNFGRPSAIIITGIIISGYIVVVIYL